MKYHYLATRKDISQKIFYITGKAEQSVAPYLSAFRYSNTNPWHLDGPLTFEFQHHNGKQSLEDAYQFSQELMAILDPSFWRISINPQGRILIQIPSEVIRPQHAKGKYLPILYDHLLQTLPSQDLPSLNKNLYRQGALTMLQHTPLKYLTYYDASVFARGNITGSRMRVPEDSRVEDLDSGEIEWYDYGWSKAPPIQKHGNNKLTAVYLEILKKTFDTAIKSPSELRLNPASKDTDLDQVTTFHQVLGNCPYLQSITSGETFNPAQLHQIFYHYYAFGSFGEQLAYMQQEIYCLTGKRITTREMDTFQKKYPQQRTCADLRSKLCPTSPTCGVLSPLELAYSDIKPEPYSPFTPTSICEERITLWLIKQNRKHIYLRDIQRSFKSTHGEQNVLAAVDFLKHHGVLTAVSPQYKRLHGAKPSQLFIVSSPCVDS